MGSVDIYMPLSDPSSNHHPPLQGKDSVTRLHGLVGKLEEDYEIPSSPPNIANLNGFSQDYCLPDEEDGTLERSLNIDVEEELGFDRDEDW